MGPMTDPATALADEIAKRLAWAFKEAEIEVVNDSHHHAGHAGDDGSGLTHWTVRVVSPAFAGVSRVERQRRVNRALADLMDAPIHALAIQARTPDEG